ncbi:SusC/RagA family TonB-linked outer membrane protein [Flavobacterium johnsoniae]|uniref:SusC-like TonB-dependent receptor n=1 Tax=Flavobacterium johnsoniae (strain ATCC 17061 / DSM 2064 / JCM 8514 / BCRC 14874 / CCUG 350202 / NBRC 14942 / NCIMB 11054 / UW101) TaxID=376686 RepID=A5FFG1_FLAJ1|nr:SusC/RagA family TonB-linked outer membrane protein [Flavobacterium johnsoniae]ABQ06056.1 SusC-like TonB-dependent receptor [Flavobacterium johnsoniae UW101]OXG00582.1 SusC/RagA family TonB-linked outer membrane protein [Flavobacterium johnsoniae UW101]WQG81794.1 SusC/RagA family TonB-linked outer membrane protein [Flavobacterium johnsoniae UW101]SHK64490.1 TonB-linked outer membrane protein, SusC/RagA family [Flavobacterium johnsoniae]
MNYFSFFKGGKAIYCLIFTGFLLSFSPSAAKSSLRRSTSSFQQHQVKGTVSDGSGPLPGVTISIKGNSKTTVISDYNGHFSIQTPAQDTLVVSYLGFKTAYVPVKSRTKIDIVLQYDTTTLQEVKVNAGYYSVKESERTGSIARITSKDIESQPVTNVLATMQGRMAGVNVTQTTGIPGGGFDIQIRGQNSIRTEGNAPLYIIDGVPYASDAIGYSQTSTVTPSVTSPLNNINPDTIESIEVLKDADATAIYGSRGANGVVLITTKKGKEGKTRFTINASTGAGKVARFIKMMDTQQYLSMRRQAFINDKINAYPANAYDLNGVWDQNRSTDWQKELIGGTSTITDMQGTISGGSKSTPFLISSSYHTESSVLPGSFIYKKGGTHLSLNHTSEDDSFNFTFSGGYNVQNSNQPATDLTSDSRSLPPNAPSLYDANGDLNWEKGTWSNPLAKLLAENKFKTKDFTANTVLTYQIIPDLVLKSSFGYTDLQHYEHRTSPSTMYNPCSGLNSSNSSILMTNTKRSSWIIEPQLAWDSSLGNGKINILIGGTFQQQNSQQLSQLGTGFTSNSLIYDLASATFKEVIFSNETIYKYQAFFARANYNWQNRYIVNLTMRRDGSSRFGPGKQFAMFGAVGAAWLFSKENWFRDSSWLSFGKLRASYGTTGSDQIGDYQFFDTYNSTGISYENIIGLQPSRLFNPDFAWEINKKLEAALEVGFFKDRIFFTSAWFRNRSSNQLVGIPLPATTGFTQLQANLGAEVQNAGWEFTLRTENFNSRHFNWNSSVNVSFMSNELLSFPDLGSSTYKNRYRIGESLNILLRYQYTGVDPVKGVYTFADQNSDGRITSPDDRQTIVNLNPDYFGGFQNQLRFKNWKLDFLFQFVKQRNLNYGSGLAGLMINQPVKMNNSWNSATQDAQYQLYSAGYSSAAVASQSFYTNSDATVADASYVRLKTLALSYDVPLASKTVLCTLMIQGQNLLTFTPYMDGDPEFKSRGYLPPLKIVTAGLQLTF